ncbi:hypothetical protein EYF80_023868 [Liparis tanakae]|uniref:Uncharacterized protein n=1 Tax=Liparis tanakae TaxID=230148 RepID=A0A4Z2HJ80_9TELE|nr:hypothetical protein EYF80_023868 [Liparis tanakae]
MNMGGPTQTKLHRDPFGLGTPFFVTPVPFVSHGDVKTNSNGKRSITAVHVRPTRQRKMSSSPEYGRPFGSIMGCQCWRGSGREDYDTPRPLGKKDSVLSKNGKHELLWKQQLCFLLRLHVGPPRGRRAGRQSRYVTVKLLELE